MPPAQTCPPGRGNVIFANTGPSTCGRTMSGVLAGKVLIGARAVPWLRALIGAGRRRWTGFREPRVGLFEGKEDRSSTCPTPPRAGAVVKQHGVGSANARTRLVSISLMIAFHNTSTESVAPCRLLRTLPRISLPPPRPGGWPEIAKTGPHTNNTNNTSMFLKILKFFLNIGM